MVADLKENVGCPSVVITINKQHRKNFLAWDVFGVTRAMSAQLRRFGDRTTTLRTLWIGAIDSLQGSQFVFICFTKVFHV